MLQRDRHLRTQVNQITDALLFAASFWLSCILRADPQIAAAFGFEPIGPDFFAKVGWLYFALLPVAPLVLESQGFYNRPVIYPRRMILLPLFKGCLIISVGLVLAMYVFHMVSTRGGMVFFGAFSFVLVMIKEEILRLALRIKMGQAQYKRRVVLVGAEKEVARLRQQIKEQP